MSPSCDGLALGFRFKGINASIKGENIKLAFVVPTKSGDAAAWLEIRGHLNDRPEVGNPPVFKAKAPEGPHGKVSVKINSLKIPQLFPAVNMAAGDA